jgi:oligopeptide/dipeptide ABC transporter ATP-binding protein
VVKYFSDAVGVMYLGKIVEYATTDELFERPFHPYTEVLLASVPEIITGDEGVPRKALLKGDVPSPINIPAGCPFHPRCPKRFEPCDKIVPSLGEQRGRLVSCHLWNPY